MNLNDFIAAPRYSRAVMWLLRWLPTRAAVAFATRVQAANLQHDPVDAVCLPCVARNRILRAQHSETVGPRATLYCIKCGLDKPKWPRYCANRVKQVNNRPPRRRFGRTAMAFWE